MSVPEGERGKSVLDAIVKANELATYTVNICTNQNVFLPQFQTAVTNKLIDTSIQIFVDAWTANNIYVRTAEDWEERKRLQEKSARECNNLLALIQLAQRVFHLKTKRIKFWSEKTIEVRNYIRAWKETDSRRYQRLL